MRDLTLWTAWASLSLGGTSGCDPTNPPSGSPGPASPPSSSVALAVSAPASAPPVATGVPPARPTASAYLPTRYTLVEACTELGGRKRETHIALESPSGSVVVREQGAVVGEMTGTAADFMPLRTALATPAFAAFLSSTTTGDLAGEGRRCTVTYTNDGARRELTWSSDDKLSADAVAGQREVEVALDALATKAKTTRYGGPCSTDADCHTASGPDCHCVAAGPPPEAGHLSRCLVPACDEDDKVRCEAASRRCVLAAPLAK